MTNTPSNLNESNPANQIADHAQMGQPVESIRTLNSIQRTGVIKVGLAARQDATIRYVTLLVSELIRAGLIPEDHAFNTGDTLRIEIDGVPTDWRVNRRSRATLATHLPAGLPMPGTQMNPFEKREFTAVVLGEPTNQNVPQINPAPIGNARRGTPHHQEIRNPSVLCPTTGHERTCCVPNYICASGKRWSGRTLRISAPGRFVLGDRAWRRGRSPVGPLQSVNPIHQVSRLLKENSATA